MEGVVGRVLSKKKKLITADLQEAVFVIHFCTYAGFYSQKCVPMEASSKANTKSNTNFCAEKESCRQQM
jgi:hypothetical protein